MGKNSAVVGIIVAGLGWTNTDAYSQSTSQCSDILNGGAFKTSNYHGKVFFRQIIEKRFLSKSFEESKSDRSLGLGFTLDDIPINANASAADYQKRQDQIRSSLGVDTVRASEIDLALSSGDEVVVGAWSKCMDEKGGGLSVRVKAETAQDAVVTIEWRSAARTYKTKLSSNIVLPKGVSIVGDRKCTRKGATVAQNVPCPFQVHIPSAFTPLLVLAQADDGIASTYLPPRIISKTEIKNFTFKSGDDLADSGRSNKTVYNPSHTVILSDEEIADGWTFDQSSAKINIIVDRDPPGGRPYNHCNNPTINVTPFSFTYGFYYQNNDSAATLVCHVEPYIVINRQTWVPWSSAGGSASRP